MRLREGKCINQRLIEFDVSMIPRHPKKGLPRRELFRISGLSLMVEEKKKSELRKSLPLEALVLTLLTSLDNQGYGYSNEISYYIVGNKPEDILQEK